MFLGLDYPGKVLVLPLERKFRMVESIYLIASFSVGLSNPLVLIQLSLILLVLSLRPF